MGPVPGLVADAPAASRARAPKRRRSFLCPPSSFHKFGGGYFPGTGDIGNMGHGEGCRRACTPYGNAMLREQTPACCAMEGIHLDHLKCIAAVCCRQGQDVRFECTAA